MSENKFNKTTSYFFGGLYRLGYLVMALGIVVLLSPYLINDNNSSSKAIIVGSVTFIAGVILSFTSEGISFDFDNRSFRSYHSFMGLKMGKWKEMPLFIRIKISQESYSYTNIPNGKTPTLSGKSTIYSIALFTSNSKPELILNDENKKRLLKEAEYLSEKFKLPLSNSII